MENLDSMHQGLRADSIDAEKKDDLNFEIKLNIKEDDINLEVEKIEARPSNNESQQELSSYFIDEIMEKLESEIIEDKFYIELKSKIEEVMSSDTSESYISKLLAQILQDDKVFNNDKHFKLIDLLIETIKSLGEPSVSSFRSDQTATILRQIMVDFLYRFKDKHPFSNSEMEEKGTMDVFNATMEFLIPYGFLPSTALIKEYTESEYTKRLNTLPSIEHLNQKFDKDKQISEESYNFLKERYSSRPPFIYFFNPNQEIEERVYKGSLLLIGYFSKGTEYHMVGAGMTVHWKGQMYQGYYKDDDCHYYGRDIYINGDIYIGGWNRDSYQGKGEEEYYLDGKIERGQWVENKKQGMFEVLYKDGTTEMKVYEDGEEVEQ